ncbi:MAG: polysaccharide deacetylase family protein [Solirubrobacteraceae bacterium]
MDLDALQLRREARRREIRRRRIAASCLIAVLAAIVAIVLAHGSSGSSPGRNATRQRTVSTAAGANRGTSRETKTTSVRDGPPGTDAIPILMYHVIAAPPPGAPFPGLYVEPSEFAEQMQALKREGWHAVTLDQAEAYWRRGVPLGAGKPIVLSFDNGYQSQYTNALPVLRRLRWVGNENIQLTGLPPSQGGLGPQEIRGLLSAGWELDTQGVSHASLISLDAEELRYQVLDARKILQRRYGIPVNWFCYPSGLYDPTVEAAVKAAGYTGATTVVPGWADPGEDPYRLHRLRVLGGTTGEQLLALVEDAREDPTAPTSFTTP